MDKEKKGAVAWATALSLVSSRRIPSAGADGFEEKRSPDGC